ncbi:MAG: erythromycin esterase family protein [Bryobacteraceae bacterium]
MKFTIAFLVLTIAPLCLAAPSGPGPVCPAPMATGAIQAFDQLVGLHEYVVLGESSHSLTAMHCLVGQVFRNLVEEKGYRILVFESAWGIEEGLRDFLSSNRTELTGQESFLLNAFNSAPIRELLIWIRGYNLDHPKDPIRLAGIQPEQPVTDFQAVWKVASLAPGFGSAGLRAKTVPCKADNPDFKTDIDYISYASKIRRKEHKAVFNDGERAACLAAVDDVGAFLNKNKATLVAATSKSQFDETLLHLDSLRVFYRTLAPAGDAMFSGKKMSEEETLKLGADSYNADDKARFQVFEELRKTRYGNAKALFWMHNWHAARHSEDLSSPNNIPRGVVSLGTRLAKAYGSKLITVGNVTACPACVEPAPADALEKKFETILGGVSAFIDVRHPVGKQRELPLNIPGTLLVQSYKERLDNVVLSRQFNGVFYLAASGLTFEDEKRAAAAALPRYVDTPDLKTILPHFLNSKGYLDPEFAAATSKPSPFYTDFYGVQALADSTAAKIKADFVPKFAELVSENEHTVKLKFKSGWTGTFYPHSTLSVMGTDIPMDHMYVSGDKWQEILKNVDEFRDLLKANGLEKAYLIPNPHYTDEAAVFSKWNSQAPGANIVLDPSLAALDQSKNAVFLAPEGVHGNLEGYNALNTVLAAHKLDWFGMEMLTTDMQPDLDQFVQSAAGAPEYATARKKLIDYFTASWNGRSGPKTTGEENYYFKLVDQMRNKKTRVIGLEGVSLTYILFRYGENAFGAAVRSYRWAQVVPATGKGVIFGGSGHFTEPRSVNVQDFIKDRNPGVQLISVAPIGPRKPQ